MFGEVFRNQVNVYVSPLQSQRGYALIIERMPAQNDLLITYFGIHNQKRSFGVQYHFVKLFLRSNSYA